jgi:hypothetical protein
MQCGLADGARGLVGEPELHESGRSRRLVSQIPARRAVT